MSQPDPSPTPVQPTAQPTALQAVEQAAERGAAQGAAPGPAPAGGAEAAGSANGEPAPVVLTEFAEFSDNLKGFIDEPTWSNAVSTFLPVLLEVGKIIFVAVVLLLIVSFLSRWATKAARTALERTHIDPTLKNFLVRLTTYIVWIMAIPVALSVLGVQATSLAAVIGAAGIAIGLGLQGALANISAGILLLVLRPVRIGDLVDIQGESGEVKDLGLFYTVVTTFQNEVVSIPNQQILSDKVQNLTGNETRRVEIPVGVAYGTDLRLAERSLLEAANSVESRVKDVEPKVWLTGFGASSIDFEVHVYCPARSYLLVRHDAVHAINDALARENIEIPFPQRTLSGSVKLVRGDTDDAADEN